jgi:hypothetical protein
VGYLAFSDAPEVQLFEVESEAMMTKLVEHAKNKEKER